MIPTEKLVELLEDATPGPWETDGHHVDASGNLLGPCELFAGPVDGSAEFLGEIRRGQDAELMALTPTLATEVLSSRKRIAELDGEIARVRAETLEEAAKVADEYVMSSPQNDVQMGIHFAGADISRDIRSLKDATP